MARMARMLAGALALASLGLACGDGDEGKAVERGVGEACAATADCRNEGDQPSGDVLDQTPLLECLTEFKGGYCGLKGCTAHADCPDGSLCVVADNAQNYCYLICVEKVDCNVHRSVDAEANCTSNVTMIDGVKSSKVCVPPMGS